MHAFAFYVLFVLCSITTGGCSTIPDSAAAYASKTSEVAVAAVEFCTPSWRMYVTEGRDGTAAVHLRPNGVSHVHIMLIINTGSGSPRVLSGILLHRDTIQGMYVHDESHPIGLEYQSSWHEFFSELRRELAASGLCGTPVTR